MIPLVCGLLAALTACGARRADMSPPTPVFTAAEVNRAIPAAVLSLRLTTSDGTPISLRTLRGKVVVLADVMTLGQDTSPVNSTVIVQAARAVERAGLGDRVTFVSVTIDPDRDTPARLADYRDLFFDAPADWVLATGTPTALDTLWRYFGVSRQRVATDPSRAVDWMTRRPLTYDIHHNDEVHFIDPTGRDRFVLGGPARVSSADDLPALLDVDLDNRGRRTLTDPALTTWTPRRVLNVVSSLTGERIPT